jgi:DNA-binding MarR family transcriptional regulator
MSGIVDRLESHGVVNRIKVNEDRRIVRISLTEKVSAIQEKLDVIRKNYWAELLKNADSEDLEKMFFGLKQLNNLVKNVQTDETL